MAGKNPATTPDSCHKRPIMKARVTVTLKSGILDPQGKAIEGLSLIHI